MCVCVCVKSNVIWHSKTIYVTLYMMDILLFGEYALYLVSFKLANFQ